MTTIARSEIMAALAAVYRREQVKMWGLTREANLPGQTEKNQQYVVERANNAYYTMTGILMAVDALGIRRDEFFATMAREGKEG